MDSQTCLDQKTIQQAAFYHRVCDTRLQFLDGRPEPYLRNHLHEVKIDVALVGVLTRSRPGPHLLCNPCSAALDDTRRVHHLPMNFQIHRHFVSDLLTNAIH